MVSHAPLHTHLYIRHAIMMIKVIQINSSASELLLKRFFTKLT